MLNGTTTVGSVVKYQVSFELEILHVPNLKLNEGFSLQCDDDYWLVGNGELRCTKDGKWSDDAPVCERKEFYELKGYFL